MLILYKILVEFYGFGNFGILDYSKGISLICEIGNVN